MVRLLATSHGREMVCRSRSGVFDCVFVPTVMMR
eukprot:gene2208-1562_t